MRMASATLLLTTIGLCACATTGLGINRASLPVALQSTYDRAQLQDKRAQFELGLAYAEGELVARDCKKAQQLLRLAAQDTGGTMWVYSPPVGNGTTGRVIPINQGPKQAGLRDAKELLQDDGFCYDND